MFQDFYIELFNGHNTFSFLQYNYPTKIEEHFQSELVRTTLLGLSREKPFDEIMCKFNICTAFLTN